MCAASQRSRSLHRNSTLSARFHVDNTLLSGETPLKVVEYSVTSQRSTVLYLRMAHLSTLPDPSPQRSPHGQKPTDASSQFSFTELTRLLGQHGAGSSSEDLALDLLLHEVVSQACSTTNAAGAAIALKRNDEFICRATSGKHAPDLGSCLSVDTGLSGACIQSREVQRCDDTELDTRVDADACRRLGVRSVVVVPLLQGSETAGVLEVLSPHAHVFTDGDVKTLTALSQQIMDTMIRPVEKEKEEDTTVSAESFVVNAAAVQPHKDPWMTVLTILIVALALLLGWMLGHRGLGGVAEREKTPSPVSAKPVVPTNQTDPLSAPVPKAIVNPTLAPGTTPKAPAESPGGLAVYEEGKLVFQVKPVPANANSIAVQIPPDAANSLLIERVEPQYPDSARLAHIQGPVVLQVDVNEKGTVQQLRALDGNPQLVAAAVEAVQHWHFKPYAPRGDALNFQTQVTVDFKLP
jgi:TonB family protein